MSPPLPHDPLAGAVSAVLSVAPKAGPTLGVPPTFVGTPTYRGIPLPIAYPAPDDPIRLQLFRRLEELAQDFGVTVTQLGADDKGFLVIFRPPEPKTDGFMEAREITPEQWASLRPAGSTDEQWNGSIRTMGLREIVAESIQVERWGNSRGLSWDRITELMTEAWKEMES